MPIDQQRLLDLWRRVTLGLADAQEKIEASWLAGESRETKYIEPLVKLLNDDEEQVRYFALQALVLDLQQIDKRAADLCWRLLNEDPDIDVRSMAATCLGKILFNSWSLENFHKLVDQLKGPGQTPHVKGAIYDALFKVAGRPPSEWPRGQLGRREFEESDIDWAKVIWLEDLIRSEP